MNIGIPFDAQAAIKVGERKHNANVHYNDTGELQFEIEADPLHLIFRQVAREGSTDVELGEQRFSYPADWVSAANISQLVRQSILAPKTITRQDETLKAEGIALGVPFVMTSSGDGKILLSITFPTLDMEIEFSNFVRLE